MRHLADEILQRFPEVKPRVFDGDQDLPYLMVGHIVDWLLSVATPRLPPDVVARVVDFDRWCMAQPRGETAADDVMTIVVVALREELFAHDALLPLVPRLIPRDELLANRDYLIG